MSNRARPRRGSTRHWLALVLFLLVGGACGRSDLDELQPSASELVLRRRLESLEQLLAADGPLVPFDPILVVVRQRLVQELIDATLPIEGVVSDRYRLRLERATLTFDDGLALVEFEGRASLAGTLENAASAEAVIYGAFDVIDFEPGSDILQMRVSLLAFEAQQIDILGATAPGRDWVQELGRQKLAALEPLFSAIAIPVRVTHQLELPGIGPDPPVTVPPLSLPVVTEVRAVTALRGMLLVTLSVALPGPS